MSAGYKWSVTIGSAEFNFQTVNCGGVQGTNDSSARKLPDRSGPNTGFTDADEDLKTFTAECEELMGSDASSPLNTVSIGKHPTTDWAVEYDGQPIASGTGLMVTAFNGSGSVPGKASGRLSFHSVGEWE